MITSKSSCEYTKLSGQQNPERMIIPRQSTVTTISPSEKTNILNSYYIVFIGLTLFASAVLMLIFMLTSSYCNYYLVSCICQLVVFVHYGSPLFGYIIDPALTGTQNKAKSCFKIAYDYYCLCKILFCFLYFNITAILILVYNINSNSHINVCFVAPSLSYIMCAFSIPLPLICLKIYDKEKNRRLSNVSVKPQHRSQNSQISLTSATTNLLNFSVSMGEGILKFCTATVYISQTVCYILYPTMHFEKFVHRIDTIYYEQDHHQSILYKILYVSNQLYFRSFVGMLLIHTIFAFILVLFEPQYQFVNKKWQIFKLILAGVNKINKPKTSKKWMCAAIIILCLVMILDVAQFISYEYFKVGGIDIEYFKVLHEQYVTNAVNIIWMAIHVVAVIVCWVYTMNFHAIANKKSDRKNSIRLEVTEIRADQTAFVIQASILLILNALNVTYLYDEDHQQYNIIRQMFIGGFMVLEAASLYFLMSVISLPNKRARKSFKKDNWRSNGLIKFYFQFIMLVNIYDFVYLSAFKMAYFHQYGLNDKLRVVSYAFSFSSLTLLTLFIHQLIISYGILNKEVHVYPHLSPKHNTSVETELSTQPSNLTVDTNKAADSIFSIKNVKKHNELNGNHDPIHTLNEINFGSDEQSSLLTSTSVREQ
eukprot:431565_1